MAHIRHRASGPRLLVSLDSTTSPARTVAAFAKLNILQPVQESAQPAVARVPFAFILGRSFREVPLKQDSRSLREDGAFRVACGGTAAVSTAWTAGTAAATIGAWPLAVVLVGLMALSAVQAAYGVVQIRRSF